MTDPLTYFATQGLMTEPGRYANLLDGLPSAIDELCRVVQGNLIHVFWAERYGILLPPTRKQELELRSVAEKLECILELDGRPLYKARPLDKRLVANCRDFSLLLTSMLRHKGIPARARCGFGAYFMPDHFEDHWVCEYWNAAEERWTLVDAQLDAFQCNALRVAFDPLDVPRNQFISGGKAWQMCRSGGADPNAFGIFDMKGLWFVRGNLVRDVAAMNKVELLPWDGWGIIEAQDDDLADDDLAFLDLVAALTYADVPEINAVHKLYKTDARLTVPQTIHSYTDNGVQPVRLALD